LLQQIDASPAWHGFHASKIKLKTIPEKKSNRNQGPELHPPVTRATRFGGGPQSLGLLGRSGTAQKKV
jgi:hypothetical protein